MSTHILDIPQAQIACETGTNEDWLDGLAYVTDATPPVDVSLDGIDFEMMLRHVTPDATAALHCTTANTMLIISGNILRFNVPADVMGTVPPTDYVFDIVGKADGYQRRIVIGTVAVVEGVTRFGNGGLEV
jgi:hypothetical protein